MKSKNKNLFLKIYIPFVIITVVILIVLQILGSKKRVGYLTDFNLEIDRTLELNNLNDIKENFIIDNELDEERLKNYLLTNENITNYVYHFRIRYYDKVFRNNDIYGVYVDLSNLPDYMENVEMEEGGSPYGNFISDIKTIEEEKIDNINYVLKIRINFIIIIITIILAILCLYIAIYFLIKNIGKIIKFVKNIKYKYLYLISGIIIFLVVLSIYNFYYWHNDKIDNLILTLFVIVSLIYFILLWTFIKYLYKNKFFELNKCEAISIIVFIAINLFIIFYYVINQREILVYDSLGYWLNITNFKIYNEYVKNILWNLDYETFFTIPATILSNIFGHSRLSVTLIIFFLYYLPTTLIAAYTIRYITNKINIKAPSFILTLAAYFMLPIFSWNLLNFMHMYGAFFFEYIIIIAYLKFRENEDLKSLLIIIPISSLCMFLWKRWTIYAAVPIILCISIDALIRAIKQKNLKLLFDLIIMGAIGVSFIFIFLYPRIIRIIAENYSVSYSAYSRDLKTSIKSIINYFGYISIIIILLSLLFRKIRNITVILTLSILINIYLFLKVQLPGGHQSMTFTHFIFIIFSIFLSYLYYILNRESLLDDKSFNKINKKLLPNFVFIIPIIIFIFSYTQSYNKLIPNFNLSPKIDSYFYDTIEIYNELPTDGLIYYANCGLKYGTDISALNTIYFQFGNYIRNLQNKSFRYETSHIDFRDGLRYGIFSCDYFFASTTPHSCELNQQVTYYPIRVFNEGLNISKAFHLEKEFKYGNYTNRLYKRIRKNTKEEIYEYVNYFNDYYTNNKIFPKAEDIENILEKYY